MRAILYERLSNEKRTIEIEAGKTVADALAGYDLDNAAVVVNGRLAAGDQTLREQDVVTVRLLPSSSDSMPWYVWAFAIPFGVVIYPGLQAYESKKAAEKAQEELEKAKKLSNKPDIDNRPFLRGASNTVATGNSQPYVIGRHLFTPYLLCSPFYRITGTDGMNEHTYTVLECGFNRQVLRRLAIDDITVKTFGGDDPQEGAYDLDTGVFAEDGRVEVSQDGGLLTDMPELNYKVASTPCNDAIPHDSDVSDGTEEYLTYTLNPYAMDVDVAITFPYGLFAYNNDGDKIETQVTVTPQYSLDGGQTWTDFKFDNNGAATNVFKRNVATKELRFVAHRDFTAADYNALRSNGQTAVYLRIRSNGNKDSQIKNDCYCLFHQSVCFDPDKSMDGGTYTELVPCKVVEDRERAYCTVIALRLKASKINEDKLKKINVITQGIARTWDGTGWSAGKTVTRNPAAWALEVLTSDSHPASRYDDREIDLDSFGEWYEWCEANGYRYDQVITQSAKKDDTLQSICDATGAAIYTDIYGRRAVAVDRPQENALAVYNPQNIIKIQNKKTFARRTDGLRIKYVNARDDLYQEDTYLVMREVDGKPLTLGADSIIKDLTVTGITEHDHIVKYARRLMAVEALRPKTTTIEVGNEGVFYTPMSKVLIQDDSLKVGIGRGFTVRGCRWYGGLLRTIYANERLTFDPHKAYGIIVNCFTADGVRTVAVKVEGDGTTDELRVLTDIRASADARPEAGNVFSFGELDADGEFSRVTTAYLISQMRRAGTGFSLELVNYDEAVYDSGAIPDYRGNMTQRPTAGGNTIPADNVTRTELDKAVAEAVGKIDPAGSGAAQEAANEVVHGVHFTSVHKIRDMELSLEEILSRMDRDAQDAAAGISVSEDEILIKVADTEKGLYSAIDLTKDEILATVADTERELRAALDIQSSAVTALVQGGGASGQMSLSLELPVMIDAAARAKLVAASSEAQVSAVYARLDGTAYYAIKGNAGGAAVKALWDRAVAASLIASQIVLSADQLNIAGKTVYTSGKSDSVAAAKASDAQSAAEKDASEKRDDMAKSLGYASYGAMSDAAERGQTIIDGGYLRTSLIEVEALLAKSITMRNGGSLRSDNYKAGVSGWKIDSDGNAEFADGTFRGNVEALSGSFVGKITATEGTFSGLLKQGANFYVASRIIIKEIRDNKDIRWSMTSSNPKYSTLLRMGKGRYAILIPQDDREYGIPRIITHYCGDLYSPSNVEPTLDTFADNSYHPGGSDPEYQANARSGLNLFKYNADGTYKEYLPIYITDNNNDDFIDPVYAIMTLIYT